MQRLTLVAVVAIGALLAACSDEGDSEDQATADRVVAAFVTRMTDQGFALAEADEDDDDDLAFDTPECEAFAAAFPDGDQDLPGEVASAESGDLERETPDATGFGLQETVTGGIGFVDDASALVEFFALFRDERLGPCLTEAFRAGFEEELAAPDAPPIVIEGLTITPTTATGVGEETVGVHLDGSMSVVGLHVAFVGDYLLARSGRVGATASTFAINGTPAVDPVALLQGLLADATAPAAP
jgi:hypothetical protein